MKTISQVIFLLWLLTTNILNNYIIPIIKQKRKMSYVWLGSVFQKLKNKKRNKKIESLVLLLLYGTDLKMMKKYLLFSNQDCLMLKLSPNKSYTI